MALQRKIDLVAENTIQLGGLNKKTGKPNPVSVTGYYLGAREVVTDYGTGKLHIFLTSEGQTGVWGKSHSNRLLTADLVGQKVELKFTGMGKPQKGKAAPFTFVLNHDPEDTVSVGSIAPVSTDEQEPDYSETEDFNEVEEDEVTFTPSSRGSASTPTQQQVDKVQALLGKRR